MKFVIPPGLTSSHQNALKSYLGNDPKYNASIWETIYEAIDLLDQGQVISDESTRT